MTITKMTGTYPTDDDLLTVTFTEIFDGGQRDCYEYEDVKYYEKGYEVSEYFMIKKYGREEWERVMVGAIRNAKPYRPDPFGLGDSPGPYFVLRGDKMVWTDKKTWLDTEWTEL